MTAISGNFYKVPQKYNQPPENSRSSTYKAAQQTNSCGSWTRPWWSEEPHFIVPASTPHQTLTEFGVQNCSLSLYFKMNCYYFFFSKHTHFSLMNHSESSWTNAFFNSSTPNTLKWKLWCKYLGTLRNPQNAFLSFSHSSCDIYSRLWLLKPNPKTWLWKHWHVRKMGQISQQADECVITMTVFLFSQMHKLKSCCMQNMVTN